MKKYLTILCDGMADRDDARGLTPMDEAYKPTMDKLCALGITGLVNTVPDGMKPGSDVCNLGVLGYDPQTYYTGRSPLEALSMGIELGDNDVTFRTNLVTLSDGKSLDERTMLDYSAGEISSKEAEKLISTLKPIFKKYGVELHAGISYRHAAVIRGEGNTHSELTPPHDILNRKIYAYLPKGKLGHLFTELTEKSIEIFSAHPVNSERLKNGLKPATCVWFWGEGTKPRLDRFFDKFGKTAAVVSAVDLVKGIGKAGDMTVVNVPTATGTVDTDYEAKQQAAKQALTEHDFCFVHLEGPDECGHQGDRAGKITAIERIDKYILTPLCTYLEASGDPFKICVMPDHATPLSVRTHTNEAIPFMIYDSESTQASGLRFTEKQAKTSGTIILNAYEILPLMFKN